MGLAGPGSVLVSKTYQPERPTLLSSDWESIAELRINVLVAGNILILADGQIKSEDALNDRPLEIGIGPSPGALVKRATIISDLPGGKKVPFTVFHTQEVGRGVHLYSLWMRVPSGGVQSIESANLVAIYFPPAR